MDQFSTAIQSQLDAMASLRADVRRWKIIAAVLFVAGTLQWLAALCR
jgi:hypothetical protein